MRGFHLFSTIVAIFGGFLFGFQFVVASGIGEFIKPLFQPDEFWFSAVISSVFLGAFAGCTFAGAMADKNGRRYGMILSALIFAITPIGAAISQSIISLIIFRFLSGIALGIISTVSPMYISEVAPASRRGQFVSFYQLAIVSGILIAYCTNYLFAGMGENNWRIMLGFGVVPAVIFLAGLIFTPESPKWLIKNGKESKGSEILHKWLNAQDAKAEVDVIKQSFANDNQSTGTGFFSMFSGKTGKIVLFGILLAVFQQISGVAAVLNYAPEIFKTIGFGDNALFQSIIIGIVNFAFTFVAIALVDRLGRKTLMLGGLIVIILSLVGLALKPSSSILIMTLLLSYVAGFSATIGPVMWVLVAEILPLRVKGPATSLATAFLWAFTMLVSFLFPIMNKMIGIYMSFGVYAVLSLIHFIFIWIFIPETKGKTLEEIEIELMK